MIFSSVLKHASRSLAARKSALVPSALFTIGILFGALPGRAQFQHSSIPQPVGNEGGTIAFERPDLTFAPQSTGIENCVNIAINNISDHPRLLTQLKSLDPRHFYVTSPAAEMLPITVSANTTFYLNICFKADEVRDYATDVLAVFQNDTAQLHITAKGLAAPEVVPVPKETSITEVTYKKHNWIFTFGLKTRGTVKLTLEDMMGKVVRNFPFQAVKSPGYYETTFDQKSDAGKKLPKGSYILRLEATDQQSRTTAHSSRLVTIK
ncbi:MAG TPA: hypothetical protein VGM92_13125 [Candidatus Kapabacteria bacterium]